MAPLLFIRAARNALANPFGGIGGEPEILGVVKFPGGGQKADTALLNQIHQRNAPPGVFLGHIHHQPEIGIDHLADGFLVSGSAPLCQIPLLLRCQPGDAPDFIEVLVDVIIQGGISGNVHFFCCFCHVLNPFLASIWC